MGSKIRQFLRDLFGSRLVERLEEDLLRTRSDFESRLLDKDQIIADLRSERAVLLGKINVYEMTLMPRASRAGADLVAAVNPKKPNFGIDFSSPPTMTRWQKVVAEHEAQLAKEAEEEKAAQAQQ